MRFGRTLAVFVPSLVLAAGCSGGNGNPVDKNILVSAPSGATSESGGQATFTVALAAKPSADVVLQFSSSNPSEGTVSPSTLTFTKLDFDAPKTVIVSGVDDDVADGSKTFDVDFAAVQSDDKAYAALTVSPVPVVNIDDETAAIVVSPVSGFASESGALATFSVSLQSQPTADVTLVPLPSDPLQATASPSSLVFTSTNWKAPQIVTVSAVNDAIANGARSVVIQLGPASSSDSGYQGMLASDPSIAIVDDDSAGILVSPPSGPTTEAGGVSSFTVTLGSQPTADVTLPLATSNPAEGTLSASSLTFTSSNWSTPHQVVVTGVDDAIADGNRPFSVVIGIASSNDTGYTGINPADVPMTNVDDDSPGILASQVTGPTSEGGGTATFTVRLLSQPTADVTIGLSSSDASEGSVSPSSLLFTADDYATPKLVTVMGVNDALADGNQPYRIDFAAAVSGDGKYSGMIVESRLMTNLDDGDTGGGGAGPITVSSASRPTSEAGGKAAITVVLGVQPIADVSLRFASNDLSEGVSLSTSMTFTSVNWNVPQRILVKGVSDGIVDGDQAYSLVFQPAQSADPTYNAAMANPVALTNLDALSVNVGYYDMTTGAGVSAQTASITAAGQNPVLMNDLTAADLANIQVLYVQNEDNSTYGSEYPSRLSSIAAWVSSGGTLIIHDRFVSSAATILPGAGAFTITRDTSAASSNIDIREDQTIVSDGPGGVLSNASLDGGNYSDHGFAVSASLPANAERILCRANPDEIVTFGYPYGQGWVVYSTIPLDYYLGGNAPAGFRQIYAPNVVAYGADHRLW